VQQLQSYATAARRLQHAVNAGERVATHAAIRQLRAASSASAEMMQAQRTATEAYNARVRRIRTLRAAVEEERRRLDRELGS
jgi:galactokinase